MPSAWSVPAESGDFALSAHSRPGLQEATGKAAHLPDTRVPPRAGSPFTGRGAQGPGPGPLGTFWGRSSKLALKPPEIATPSQGPFPSLPASSCCGRLSVLLRPSPSLPGPLEPLPRPLPAQSAAGACPLCPRTAPSAAAQTVLIRTRSALNRINLGPRGLPSDLSSPGFQRPLHPLIFSQSPDKKAKHTSEDTAGSDPAGR